MNTKMLLLAAVISAGLAAVPNTGLGQMHLPGLPHLSYRRVRSQAGLPFYDYHQGVERIRDRAVAIADPTFFEEWLPTDREATEVRQVARKPFHFTRTSLVAHHATLQQVGLTVWSNGAIVATGRISHDGGPDGSLAGANVTIILRAYAAPVTDHPGPELPINTPMIWESRRRLWVSRHQPEVISLTGTNPTYAEVLRRNFNQITHLEVELEAERDR